MDHHNVDGVEAAGASSNDTTPENSNGAEPADQSLEMRAQLVMAAEKLLERGATAYETHRALSEHMRELNWPEEYQIEVIQIVMDAEMKSVRAKAAEQAAARAEANREELQVISLADVQPEEIKWLWWERIPLGKVTVIFGEAGVGKTSLALELAARVSTGKNWPDQEENTKPGQVLILNGEDSLNETVSPKLRAAGADLSKISALGKIQKVGGTRRTRRFDLGRDLLVLRERLEALPDAKLVLIDSLELFSGVLGLTKSQMRGVLADLEELAAERGVAIVVLSTGTKCDLPVKNVWRVDRDVAERDRRYLLPVRSSWCDFPYAQAFKMTGTGIVWEERYRDREEGRYAGATPKEQKNRQLAQQIQWLREFLGEGPQPVKTVLAEASGAGWSAGQMRRAREALGVQCWKEKVPQGGWMWELPREDGGVPAVEDVKGVERVKDVVAESRESSAVAG